MLTPLHLLVHLVVLAHLKKEVKSFPCDGGKFLVWQWKVSCALVESLLYAGGKFLVYRWKISCALVESFLYTGGKFLFWQWKLSCAPVESFWLKTHTGRFVLRHRTLPRSVWCALCCWLKWELCTGRLATDAGWMLFMRPVSLSFYGVLWVSVRCWPGASGGRFRWSCVFDKLSAYVTGVHRTRPVSTWPRPVVPIWPLEINVRVSSRGHVTVSRAPDALFQRSVAPCSESGAPVFRPVNVAND